MKKSNSSIHIRLFQYMRTMRYAVAGMGALSILTGICIVLQARYLAQAVNGAFLGGQALAQVAFPLAILIAVIIIRAVLIWIGEIVAQCAACTVKKTLRRRLFAHLLKLGPLYMKGERSGEMVQTLTDGVESLDAYFGQLAPQVCTTLCVPLIILGVIFVVDWPSALILLVTMPVLPFFMVLIGKLANTMTQRRWQMLNQMSAHFLDVLQGLTTLKLFGRSQAQRETVRRVSEGFGEMTMRVLRVAFLSALVMEMGATICTALVAVEIGLRLLYGYMPFEQAFFVLLLAPEFFQPLRTLGTQFHASMSSTAGAQRIFEILDIPPQSRHQPIGAGAVGPAIASRSLAFKDVSASYRSPDGKVYQALKGVSMRMQRGQKIALVGPTGAGKSTIAHLLLRFLELEQGSIVVDGLPLDQIPVEAWRQLVAWQPQHPTLFDTTVAENIRLGCPGASLEEIIQAAKQAAVHGEILALPQGYETIVGERGTRLSGGQIQRVSLARAFVKNAPILLLDEATSTLDPASEERVQQSIDALAGERIVLIIAHRLHTIMRADEIILLNEGRVVDSGNHHTLIQHSAFYAALVRAYTGEEVLV